MVNMNVNRDHGFVFEPSTLAYDATRMTQEGAFYAYPDKMVMTNYAFAAPAPSLFFCFDVTQKIAVVPSNAFKAVVKKVAIIKYVNYHLGKNEEPLILAIKSLRDGWALNFAATNEVVLAVACPDPDPFRLVSIHIYKDSKNLTVPMTTLNEMVLTIRRYFQAKNPLLHVALSYQNSNGVLLAMDSSRIKGMDWRGLHYNYNSIPRMEFTLRLNTQLFMEKRWTNITRPALTLLIDPFQSSDDKILNSYESLWLTNGTIHCHDKGSFTIYRGFPNEFVDEARIIGKDRNTVDFLYLEGIAITFIYRRVTWTVEVYEPCFVHLDFSTSSPSSLSQLPFNGTITRYPDPDGKERGPIMFNDLGSPLKYTLKLNDSPQIIVATSDNTVIMTESDGTKEFTSHGLKMTFSSGSVRFTIEPGTNTSASSHNLYIFAVLLLYEYN